MKIIAALDSFKGSMTAERACSLVAEEIHLRMPSAIIKQQPLVS